MKNKRRSRILALKFLYAWDLRTNDDPHEICQSVLESTQNKIEMADYALKLAQYVFDSQEMIDELIQGSIQNWDIRRLSRIDRNILRLAIAELYISKDVPYKVIVDEAVEIAKLYSTPDSGKFVNGVIDAIYKNCIKQSDTRIDPVEDPGKKDNE